MRGSGRGHNGGRGLSRCRDGAAARALPGHDRAPGNANEDGRGPAQKRIRRAGARVLGGPRGVPGAARGGVFGVLLGGLHVPLGPEPGLFGRPPGGARGAHPGLDRGLGRPRPVGDAGAQCPPGRDGAAAAGPGPAVPQGGAVSPPKNAPKNRIWGSPKTPQKSNWGSPKYPSGIPKSSWDPQN